MSVKLLIKKKTVNEYIIKLSNWAYFSCWIM